MVEVVSVGDRDHLTGTGPHFLKRPGLTGLIGPLQMLSQAYISRYSTLFLCQVPVSVVGTVLEVAEDGHGHVEAGELLPAHRAEPERSNYSPEVPPYVPTLSPSWHL